MAKQQIKSAQIDWSSFSNNIKGAQNTSSVGLTNGVDTNLSSAGAAVTFTVASACVAFVTIHVGVSSTTEYELRPEIFLDGSVASAISYAANISGGTNNRTTTRSHSAAVPLSAGAHTLSAGVFVSSATSPIVATQGASITAIVLGQVTA